MRLDAVGHVSKGLLALLELDGFCRLLAGASEVLGLIGREVGLDFVHRLVGAEKTDLARELLGNGMGLDEWYHLLNARLAFEGIDTASFKGSTRIPR